MNAPLRETNENEQNRERERTFLVRVASSSRVFKTVFAPFFSPLNKKTLLKLLLLLARIRFRERERAYKREREREEVVRSRAFSSHSSHA